MKLHVLGVNGPFPESNGATSGYLLEVDDTTLIQLDLGSGVLSILYQGLFPVSAVPANILVMPLAYLAFVMAGATLFFSWAGPLALAFSGLLEQIFRLIGWLGRFFGGLCETAIPRPPVWTVVLFLAAFFCLLRT